MRTTFRIVFDDGHHEDFGVNDFDALPSTQIHAKFMRIVKKYIRKNYPDEPVFWARLYRRYYDGTYGSAVSAACLTDYSYCDWSKL